MARASGSALTHLRGVVITFPWLAWLLVADVLLSLLLPIKIFYPDFVYNLSSQIAYTVWRWIQYIFETLNAATITTSGDVLPTGESAIVVANHVGWSDFYMIQALALKAGMLGRCRWFAKIQLRSVPFLGWGLWAMGFPLVSRNWMKDKAELDRVFRGIVDRKWPTWLISFSEATRFTNHKFVESQEFCAANAKPQPQHLLYPRTKGFVTTVQHLRKASHVKAVYVLTLAYQRDNQWHEAPDMWETMSVPNLSRPGGFRFHIHARRYPIQELPTDDGALARWLEQRWVEKGDWLEQKRVEWAGGKGVDQLIL